MYVLPLPHPALADLSTDVGVIHEYIFPSPSISLAANATLDAAVLYCAEGVNASCSAVEALGADKAVEGTMEFLPLMLISLYCAVGIVWAWLRLSWVYLRR